MAKYLVIVESPAKVKTIKKFLGSNYEVMASQGHVRDLPKSQMGIDVENDFEPIEYGFSCEEACQEAGRCLRCDHFGFGAFRGGREEQW